jgi:AraC-like DNA-binding protein
MLLARSASVSRAYFSRSFKSAFGETPHQYLMSRRMERAMALLRAAAVRRFTSRTVLGRGQR